MVGRLKGKVAFLTAAGQGIGRATALAFAREGATVFASDISEDKLRKLSKIANIDTIQLDVLKESAILEVTGKIPTPNILFNCCGFVHQGSILDCSIQDWDYSFDLNVRSHFLLTKALIPKFLERQDGSIINISSVASSVKGIVNRFAYGASKAAVIGMTKSLAADFVDKGIRVNAICPGTIDTPSLENRMKDLGEMEAARKMFISRQPMNRLGTAEEIAEIAVYLGSDESKFMTGQAVVLDGGITI